MRGYLNRTFRLQTLLSDIQFTICNIALNFSECTELSLYRVSVKLNEQISDNLDNIHSFVSICSGGSNEYSTQQIRAVYCLTVISW
jgi:hypothetical protein